MSTLQTYNLKHPDASGNQITFTSGGNLNITGDATITGDTTITGATDITGDLEVAGDVQAESLNGGQLGGFRSLIINGAMEVAQRGTTRDIAVNTQQYPCVDRIRIELGGQASPDYTYSQDDDAPPGFETSFKVLNNTGATQASTGTIYNLFGTNIEQSDTDRLGWGTANPKSIVVSFWIKSSMTGSNVVELVIRRNGTSSNETIAGQIVINAANTWEYKTIVLPGTTTDIGRPDSNGLAFNLFFVFQGLVGGNKISSYGSWDANNRLGGPAGDTNVFAQTTGAYLNITGLQLEEGTQSTPFEYRPIATTLALCKRYYQNYTLSSGNEGVGILRGSFISGASEITRLLPVSMRAAPSFAGLTSNTSLTARKVDGSTSTNATVDVDNVTSFTNLPDVDNQFNLIRFRFSPGLTDGEPYLVWNNGQPELVYSADAEL